MDPYTISKLSAKYQFCPIHTADNTDGKVTGGGKNFTAGNFLPLHRSGLDIGLVGPVARGASRFENLLAPQKTYWPGGPVDLKTYWPPKKLTGPYLKTKLARRKTICINLQFAHRPIIKLFRSHPRNIFQI